MLPILCICFALSATAQTVNPALKTRPVITNVQSNPSTHDGDVMNMTAEAKIKSLEADVQLLKTQVQDLQASLQKETKDSKDALQFAVQVAKGQTITLDNKLTTKLDALSTQLNTKLGSSDLYSNTYTIDIAKETSGNQGIYDYTINDGTFTSNSKAIVAANLADNAGNYAVPVKAYFGGDNKWHVTIAKYFINDIFGASLRQCPTCSDYPGLFPVAGIYSVGKDGTLKLNVRVINVK